MKYRNLLIAALTFSGCTDAAAPRQPLDTDQLSVKTARVGGTALPTFGGGGVANAINDGGIVVGSASEPNKSRTEAGLSYPAKWVRNAADGSWVVRPLGTAGGQAMGVNEAGDAVGLLLIKTGEIYTLTAIFWPAAGGEIPLGTGVARGINDAGIIVGGTSGGAGAAERALAWTPNDGSDPTRHELPLLEADGATNAWGINKHGVISGGATRGGLWRAVIWIWMPIEGGWSEPIPRDGTEAASTGTSSGFAMNDNGDVVGYARPCPAPTCNGRPYLWPAGGGSFDLQSLNSSVIAGRSSGIANEGDVVGTVYVTRGNGGGPFLWRPGATTLTDLGEGEARGINNRAAAPYGQEVVGYTFSSRSQKPMVWQVP